MHVAHVGKYYPPYRGGIEAVVEQLCRGLARRRVRVTALVSNDSRATQVEELDQVRVIRLGRSLNLNSQPFNVRLLSALRELQADVIHFHTPNPLGALTLLGARLESRIVVTHHSDIVRQRIAGVIGGGVHALLYARSDAIVAPTPRHIEYSRVLKPFRNKAHVIHLPIECGPYATAPATWDPQLPSAFRDSPLALFVGRLVYYKGVDVLLRALASVPGLGLAVVGTGPLEPQLRQLTDDLGLQPRVAYLGGVSDERLRSLYKCARCLVLPSVAPSEAFGMVQVEAMAAGCAVISTDLRSGVPYVNVHGVTGLVVQPENDAALAGALRQLRDSPEYAAKLGAAGVERAKGDFDVERIVDRHLELYEMVGARSAS